MIIVYTSKTGTNYKLTDTIPTNDVNMFKIDVNNVNILIPKYNIFHIYSICHYSSCIQMLSMCAGVITHVSDSKLKNILSMQYSHVPIYYADMLSLATIANIDYRSTDDANDTMCKLYSYMYTPNCIHRSMLFYYNCSNNFLLPDEEKLQFTDILIKIHPIYLIINVDDFLCSNVPEHIELGYKLVISNLIYKLIGFITYINGHYICVYIDYTNNKLRLYNDLDDRYNIFTMHIDGIDNLSKSIMLYVSITD